MTRVIIISLLALALMFPVGCSSKYLVKTKDGKEYTSSAKPKYDKKMESCEFKTVDGQKLIIPKEQVAVMERK
jgi:hypothetical protein